MMENHLPNTRDGGIAKVHAVIKAGGNSTSGEVDLDINDGSEMVAKSISFWISYC